MPSDTARDPVCSVCSRSIPPGTALTFMRRNNVIHDRCLAAAQRRAEAPPSSPSTTTTSLDPASR
jgi:hypothetical protein